MSRTPAARLRRRLAVAANALGANRVYRVRAGLARGFVRRGGSGWLPALVRRETAEHRFLRTLSLEGRTVYDIGAFEGMLTLFFWSRTGPGGTVVSFEPNPVNRARLLENLALNGVAGVHVEPVALGDRPGTATIAFDPRERGRSSLARQRRPADNQASVPLHRLDDYRRAHGLPEPDLLKIDVEGFEREVLAGAIALLEGHRPSVFVELHGDTVDERRLLHAPMLELLFGAGYSVLHVETGASLEPGADAWPRGHLYCRPIGRPDRVAGAPC